MRFQRYFFFNVSNTSLQNQQIPMIGKSFKEQNKMFASMV